MWGCQSHDHKMGISWVQRHQRKKIEVKWQFVDGVSAAESRAESFNAMKVEQSKLQCQALRQQQHRAALPYFHLAHARHRNASFTVCHIQAFTTSNGDLSTSWLKTSLSICSRDTRFACSFRFEAHNTFAPGTHESSSLRNRARKKMFGQAHTEVGIREDLNHDNEGNMVPCLPTKKCRPHEPSQGLQ